MSFTKKRTNSFEGQGQEWLPVEEVCKQPQAVSEGIHRENSPSPSLVRLPRKCQRGKTWFRTNLTSCRPTEGRDSTNFQISSPHRAQDISQGFIDTNSLETSICFDTTHKPPICNTASTSIASQPSSVDQQLMDQVEHLEKKLSNFQKQYCKTLAAAAAISSQCQGIHTSWLFKNTDTSKPCHPTSSAESSGVQRTVTAQRITDFISNCWQATTRT